MGHQLAEFKLALAEPLIVIIENNQGIHVTADQSSELMLKLNRETSRILWKDLQRFFAQGAVLLVGPELDLIATAAAVANDDSASVSAWMKSEQLMKASEEVAARWLAEDCEVWAVVVAPWVLVQKERNTA